MLSGSNVKGSCPESLMVRGQVRLFGVAGSNLPGSVSSMLSGSNVKGSCPESLVARGQARLFRVAGLNLPGSVGTSLSDRSVSVSLIHACGGITPCV